MLVVHAAVRVHNGQSQQPSRLSPGVSQMMATSEVKNIIAHDSLAARLAMQHASACRMHVILASKMRQEEGKAMQMRLCQWVSQDFLVGQASAICTGLSQV